ncbi:hypothetical protein ACFVUH_29170 [Kitasatospora sp. NPDC058032]|uniref:hypothetical protein n=1 Tax=unclassified Kitasatospora TaxID=2633591 RepID=UPI0033B1935C
MEQTVDQGAVPVRGGSCGTEDRPALADLARLDAGELAGRLELALAGAGVRPVSPFDSAI